MKWPMGLVTRALDCIARDTIDHGPRFVRVPCPLLQFFVSIRIE